jgi:hypothetical protein
MYIKKIIALVVILTFLVACNKSTDNLSSDYTARIVGFDLNCSTCILEFTQNSLEVIGEIGKSPDNYYQAINLNRENFKIGQTLKVKIRKAETNELRECITMFPTYNYKNVFILDYNNLIFNDPISLSYRDCLTDPENQMSICLDSVFNDSRCPIGVVCIWEGNATVRLKYEKYNGKPVLFDLNTNNQFATDSLVDGYKFTLIGLSPYPEIGQQIIQKDYKAELSPLLSFKIILSPDLCLHCHS